MAAYTVLIGCDDTSADALKTEVDTWTAGGNTWTATVDSSGSAPTGYDLMIWVPYYYDGHWASYSYDSTTVPVVNVGYPNVLPESHWLATDPSYGTNSTTCDIRSGASHAIIDATSFVAGDPVGIQSGPPMKSGTAHGNLPASAYVIAEDGTTNVRVAVVEEGDTMLDSHVAPARQAVAFFASRNAGTENAEWFELLEATCRWAVGDIGVGGSATAAGSAELSIAASATITMTKYVSGSASLSLTSSAPVPVIARRITSTAETVTVTSTLTGSIEPITILGGDVVTAVATTGDMVSGTILQGALETQMSQTGQIEMTRVLGANISTTSTLTGSGMKANAKLPAGEISVVNTVAGSFAPEEYGGDLDVAVSLAGTLFTDRKMAGNIYTYVEMSLGPPVPHLRVLQNSVWSLCWPTVYLGAGVWKRAVAKMWNGSVWLNPDASSSLVSYGADFWFSSRSIANETDQGIADSIEFSLETAVRGTTAGVEGADPEFAVKSGNNFLRIPASAGNNLSHGVALDSSAESIRYRARVRRNAGTNQTLFSVSGGLGLFLIAADGKIAANIATVTLPSATGQTTAAPPLPDGELVWVDAYWNTVDGNWIFQYSLSDVNDPDDVVWIDYESVTWAADTFRPALDTATLTACSIGAHDLYYSAISQDGVPVAEIWPDRDAVHGSYGAPDAGQTSFNGWTVDRSAGAPRSQVVNADVMLFAPGDEMQIPASTNLYVLAREWPAGTTSLREDIDPMAGTFDGEIFDIVGFDAPLSAGDKAQMEIELLYGAYIGLEP